MAVHNERRPAGQEPDEKQHRTAYATAIIAVVGTLVAAGIGFGGAWLGAHIAREAAESTQLREIKQAQYSKTIGSVEDGLASYRLALGLMRTNQVGQAKSQLQEKIRTNTQTEELAALQLIASENVHNAGKSFVGADTDFQRELLALGFAIEEGKQPTARGFDAAETKLEIAENKSYELMSAMRSDLGIGS